MEEANILNLYREVAALPGNASFPVHPARQGPSLLPVAVHASGKEKIDLSRPFICRSFSSLPADPQLFKTLLCREKEVYGYRNAPQDNSFDWDDATFPGAMVWGRFCDRSLEINIVDSECSEKAPILHGWHFEALNIPDSVGWVLTIAPKCSYFHVDPPYGDCFMYLCRGRKVWLFISPEALAEVESRHGFDIINRLTLPELLLLDEAFLWGKIWIGEICDGDFIYFPQDWPHYVRTFEDSFGYGGYFEKNQPDL